MRPCATATLPNNGILLWPLQQPAHNNCCKFHTDLLWPLEYQPPESTDNLSGCLVKFPRIRGMLNWMQQCRKLFQCKSHCLVLSEKQWLGEESKPLLCLSFGITPCKSPTTCHVKQQTCCDKQLHANLDVLGASPCPQWVLRCAGHQSIILWLMPPSECSTTMPSQHLFRQKTHSPDCPWLSAWRCPDAPDGAAAVGLLDCHKISQPCSCSQTISGAIEKYLTLMLVRKARVCWTGRACTAYCAPVMASAMLVVAIRLIGS